MQEPNRRHTSRVVLSLLAGLMLAGLLPASDNQIVMRVNDQIATLIDYQKRLVQQRRAIDQAAELTEQQRQELRDELEETVLGGMLDELLVASRARQLGLSVTEFEMQQAMIEMRERQGLQDDRTYQMALQQSGVTEADLRDQYRRDQYRYGVISREVRPRIELEEEDLRQVYRDEIDRFEVPEQLLVEEVVVLEGVGAAERAQTIYEQLKSGESLEAVRDLWGDKLTDVLEIGWVSPGDLDPTLEAAVWDLESGEYGEPVEARGGFHLLKIVDRKEATVRPFEEVREQIQRAELNRRILEEFEDYLSEVQEDSYVDCRGPEEVRSFCAERLAQSGGRLPGGSDRFGLDDVDRLLSPSVTPLGGGSEAESEDDDNGSGEPVEDDAQR